MTNREKLLLLADTGHFNAESLLNEIVVSMSDTEARETLEHIAQHYDIELDQIGEY